MMTMNWEFRSILLIPVLAAAMTAGVAIYAVSRWRVASWVPHLFFLTAVIAVWSLGYAFEIAALSLSTKLFFAKIQYLGIATVSLFWFLFAAHYVGYGKYLTWWVLGLLAVVPAVTIALVFTNERHLLVWRTFALQETSSFLALKVGYGDWFWVHVIASYSLFGVGTLMVVNALRRFPRAYRWQLVLLVFGSLLPWLGNLYSLLDLGPIPELDLTPMGFALAGMILAWVVFRFNLFDLVPVARRVTLDSMREGVLVLDLQNRIVDVNPAARAILAGGDDDGVIGRPLADYFVHQPAVLRQYDNLFEGDSVLTLWVQGEPREYELQISPLYDDALGLRGRLFVLRDATPRRRAESQLAASEARYRLVSEMVSDYAYAYCVDEQGEVTLEWVTEAFARVTGYSAAAMQGQGGWLAVVHPGDREMFRGRIGRLLAGESDVLEYRIVTRAGEVRWLRDVGRSLRDGPAGRVGHIYGAATDITEGRKAQEALLAQKQLFESLVQVARATAEGPEIEKVLQNAVYVAATLTGAELGSLLLVDEDLRVTHSFLSGRENRNGQHDGLLQTVMRQGLAHWVVVNGRSTLVGDTFQDERWVKLPGEVRPARSALAVPIMSGERAVGVLTLQHSQVDFFQDEFVGLMEAAADQMALALRNAQMYDLQHRLADHQTILYEVLRLISSHLTPETVVQTATEAIARLTQWMAVAILVYEEAENQFVVRSATGGLAGLMGEMVPVRLGNSERPLSQWNDPLPAEEGLGWAAGRQVLSVPLWHGGERIGVFYVESEQKRPFSRNDRQLAEALAEAISLAMDNARTHVELREYAAGLSTLYTVTRQASSSLIIGDTLEKTLYAAMTALGFEMGVIALLHSDDDLLHVEATFGFSDFVIQQMRQSDMRGSVCEFVHLRQEPLQIDDARQDFAAVFQLQPEMRDVLDSIEQLGARAYSGIPLLHRGESLGSLCLFSRQPRALTLSEVSLQITIGQQITTALINANLYEQAQQQLREQTAIREAIAVMTSTIALPDVLSRIAQQMCRVLEATSAYICSFDGETFYSTVLAEYIDGAATASERESDLGSMYDLREQFPRDLQLIKVGWPTTIHADDEDLNAYERHHLQKYGVKSFLVLPMQFGGKTVAYAEVWESRRRREFSPDEVALGQAIAQQASIAFENARLFQSVENERTRLKALIQASRDGIVLIGVDNRIKVVNQMALALLGLPDGVEGWMERPLRHAIKQLRSVSPQLVALVLREAARLAQNSEQPGFGEFEANNYITQWLNLPVVADGNRIGHLLILRNVTDERRLGRMREDLVHTIVHDLRNPLSAVNICVELMTEQLATVPMGREIYDYLGIVQRNTEKTVRLVDMILDINRLESGQMPISFRPVVLSAVVDEVLNLQRPLAEEEQIRLEKDVALSLPKVMIDTNLIERVLQNLLDNALKTTPSGRGVIRVEARSVSTEQGRRVWVSVVDNGPGIPMEIRDHMFQKFITGEGQRRRGTGLGLAFCRMALDAHHEDIWVAHSEPGVGTTITFSLPLALG